MSGVFVITSLLTGYCRTKGIPLSAVPNLNGILISLPALGLWIPISLVLGNVGLHCVPPLRRINERDASKTGRSGFVEAQKDLLKALLLFALICIPMILLGFIL
jgi:hypothetical protein